MVSVLSWGCIIKPLWGGLAGLGWAGHTLAEGAVILGHEGVFNLDNDLKHVTCNQAYFASNFPKQPANRPNHPSFHYYAFMNIDNGCYGFLGSLREEVVDYEIWVQRFGKQDWVDTTANGESQVASDYDFARLTRAIGSHEPRSGRVDRIFPFLIRHVL